MIRRYIGSLCFLFTLCPVGSAQGPDTGQDGLKAKLSKKLASAWIQNADWRTSFAEAKSKAKESGQLIFGYFTRSYAP